MPESDVLRGLRRKLAIMRRERDFLLERNKEVGKLLREAWARNDVYRGQLEAYHALELERAAQRPFEKGWDV
jgi:hypothetical protein